MPSVINVDENSFKKEVLEAGKPVVVDFWAEWCGPCKTLGSFLEEISIDLNESAKIVKVNIDQNTNLVTEYGVRSIPTLMIFKKGKVVDVTIGAIPKTSLLQWIRKAID